MRDSVQVLDGRGSAAFHVPVPMGPCSVVRFCQEVPSLLGVTLGLALGEHAPPKEICHCNEESCLHAGATGRGLIEVEICLVVTFLDSCETTEGVANQARRSDTTASDRLFGPRRKPVE